MADEKINERLLEIYKNINSAHFEVKNMEKAFNLKEDEEEKLKNEENKVIEVESFINKNNQKILDDLPVIVEEKQKDIVEKKLENKDIENILNEIKTHDYFKDLFPKNEQETQDDEQQEKVQEEPNEKQIVYNEFERIFKKLFDKKEQEIKNLKSNYEIIISEKDKLLVDKINSVMGIIKELEKNLLDKQKEIKNLNLEKIKMERLNEVLMKEHNAISQLEEIELE